MNMEMEAERNAENPAPEAEAEEAEATQAQDVAEEAEPNEENAASDTEDEVQEAAQEEERAAPEDQAPVKEAEEGEEAQEPEGDKDQDQEMFEEYLADVDYKTLRRGDLYQGVVVQVNDEGVVVDFGSKREGFVPAQDLKRLVDEEKAKVKEGATVPVVVTRPEGRQGNPILSINQAYLHEDWVKADEMKEAGEIYEGEVSGYNRGGLIVRFGKIRGFVPASQVVGMPRRLSEDKRRERLSNLIGEEMGLKIIEVDRRRRRLIFSQRRAYRQWQEKQREKVIAELKEGEIRHGRVTDITNFGAFVDLGGADGLIHISELSWKRVKSPREVVNVGDEVDVYVISLDRKRKRIGLSLKKLQPNPWEVVGDHYEEGEIIEGKVTRVMDFGAFIEVDLGIEGLLPASEMIGTPELKPKELLKAGETLPVKVIHIDSRRRRLTLSARRMRRDEWERWMAQQQEEEAKEEAEEIASPEQAEMEAEPEATEEQAEAKEDPEATDEQAEVAEAEPAEDEEPEAESTEAPEAEEVAAEESTEGEASQETPVEESEQPEGEETETDA